MSIFGYTDPYDRQIEAFAASLLNDTPTSPDLADGIAALRIVEAVHALESTFSQTDCTQKNKHCTLDGG